jgi:hypothetical protein
LYAVVTAAAAICLVGMVVGAHAVNGGGLPYSLPSLDPTHSTPQQYEDAISKADGLRAGYETRINQWEGKKLTDAEIQVLKRLAKAKSPKGCIGWAKFLKNLIDAAKDGEKLATAAGGVEQAQKDWQLFRDDRDTALNEYKTVPGGGYQPFLSREYGIQGQYSSFYQRQRQANLAFENFRLELEAVARKVQNRHANSPSAANRPPAARPPEAAHEAARHAAELFAAQLP